MTKDTKCLCYDKTNLLNAIYNALKCAPVLVVLYRTVYRFHTNEIKWYRRIKWCENLSTFTDNLRHVLTIGYSFSVWIQAVNIMNIFLGGFYVLCILCAILFFYTRSKTKAVTDAGFQQFQRTYLVVYLLAMGK